MRLDPQTKVETLLRAMPSSGPVFEKLGIHPQLQGKSSLQQVCTDRGVALDELLRELDAVDWEKETDEKG